MENLTWYIYAIDVLCGGYGSGTKVIISMLFVLCIFIYCTEKALSVDEKRTLGEDQMYEMAKAFPLKGMLWVLSLVCIIGFFIPSEKTAYIMLAASGATEIVNNKEVQDIMGEGLDILKLTLKQYKDTLGE